jgi:hypothetical protein
LPDIFKPTVTKKNLTPFSFDNIRYRVIEEIPWNSDFGELRKLEEILRIENNIKKDKRDKRNTKKLISKTND